jgi:SAM-dependent methyltransferase
VQGTYFLATLEFLSFIIQIFNYVYNPKGYLSPKNYRLPFSNMFFTFALANSLFTHLLPPATKNYIAEISRVLKPGGRCLSSWFLIDTNHSEEWNTSVQSVTFPFLFEYHAQHSLYAPEQAVAYRLPYLTTLLLQQSLAIEGIYFGGGRADRLP